MGDWCHASGGAVAGVTIRWNGESGNDGIGRASPNPVVVLSRCLGGPSAGRPPGPTGRGGNRATPLPGDAGRSLVDAVGCNP